MRGEFLVGWGSFAEVYRRPQGHKTFLVVDDYTSCAIWDDLNHTEGLPKEDCSIANIMHPLAQGGGLFNTVGVVDPGFNVLPVVYCIEHGKSTGKYITHATAKDAAAFIIEEMKSVNSDYGGL